MNSHVQSRDIVTKLMMQSSFVLHGGNINIIIIIKTDTLHSYLVLVQMNRIISAHCCPRAYFSSTIVSQDKIEDKIVPKNC